MSELPAFRYHPDPVATGSAEPATAPCEVCGRLPAYVYAGPVRGAAKAESICLHCIADGSASEALGDETGPAQFTDATLPRGIDPAVVIEVEHRTPGFYTWQEAEWLLHCGDAADLVERSLRDGLTPQAVEAAVADLHPDGNVTAYLFRCVYCGTHLAYWDAS